MRNRRGMRLGLGGAQARPPPAWIWGVKGSPSPAQLQPRCPPPAGFPGAAGLTAFSCSSRSFILVPKRPEAGERVPGERVPGERPEVATRPGRGRGSARRRRRREAAAGKEEGPRPRKAPPRRPLRPRRRRALQIRLPGRRRRAALIRPRTRPSPGPRPRSSLKGPRPAAACPLGVSRSTCPSFRTGGGTGEAWEEGRALADDAAGPRKSERVCSTSIPCFPSSAIHYPCQALGWRQTHSSPGGGDVPQTSNSKCDSC